MSYDFYTGQLATNDYLEYAETRQQFTERMRAQIIDKIIRELLARHLGREPEEKDYRRLQKTTHEGFPGQTGYSYGPEILGMLTETHSAGELNFKFEIGRNWFQ